MARPPLSPFGRLLRHWRRARGLSQLDLALGAGVSARHLSFLETGRSAPSRSMVLLLGEALELPFRERNALLDAAGYAHRYSETPLGSPEMAQVRRVLAFLLERHEPFPAVVLDRRRDIAMRNAAALRMLTAFVDPRALPPDRPPNALRLVCDPAGLRRFVVNWERVAGALLRGLAREAQRSDADPELEALLEEMRAYPGVSEAEAALAPEPPGILVPLHLKRDGLELRLFTTLATVGAARDVTLQELRLECFLPADGATEQALRSLA